MWVEIAKSKEWIPFDADHTDKVFYDGEKGWAIKQKDGKVYHVSEDIYEKYLLRELDYDEFFKKRQINELGDKLTADNIKDIKGLLETIKKKHKEGDD